jgi:hypothetical protein
MRVLRIRILPSCDQPLDLGGIALGGGRMQTRIDVQLGSTGRNLRQRERSVREHEANNDRDAHERKSPGWLGRDSIMGSLGVVWGVGITPRQVKGFRLSNSGHFRAVVTTRTLRAEPDSVRASRTQERSR